MWRDNNIWLVGSWYGKRYAGNSKFFFDYLVRNKQKNIKVFWVTDDLNIYKKLIKNEMPVVYKRSIKGIWVCLRAGVYVYDCKTADINRYLSRKALTINLWHGIPLKKIERDIGLSSQIISTALAPNLKGLAYRLLKPELVEKHSLFLSTSAYVSERFKSAFILNDHQVINCGYPIYDGRLTICEKMKRYKENYRSTIMYVPTFRDYEEDAGINWEQLDVVFSRNKAILLCKFHPVDRYRIAIPEGLSNIVLVDNTEDVYDYLWGCDLLITDYSSVFYDYLLMDKPMLFYPYDYENYIKKSRELYADYFSEVPGSVALTFRQLLGFIGDFLEGKSDVKMVAKRQKLLQKTHQHVDFCSSERIYKEIQDELSQ